MTATVSSPKVKWLPRAQYAAQMRAAAGVRYVDYEPWGAVKELFSRKDRELFISGPAGTGKTRGCLEKINWCLEKYPNARGFMARKTRRSLTQSAMVTFEQEVLPNPTWVPFHGGDQEYRYPNGSILYVAGLDDPQKLLSSQWDIGFIPQAEELLEHDWEIVARSRMRNQKMPYAQVIGDCNPGPPEHWILGRKAAGKAMMLESRHQDNPLMWNSTTQQWTPWGLEYLADLDALTGALYKRLRLGQWAGAEGTVYEEVWDAAVHVIDRFYKDDDLAKDQVPADWPRYWTVDFGYTNPFVWKAFAQDPDGRLIMYKEIYKTKRLVEDHARDIVRVTKNEPKPKAIICDHDAEDRATLERHIGMATKGAWKSVRPGIQAVTARLRKAGDGKPRVLYMRDSLVEIDRELLKKHLPTCTTSEFDVYAWDTSNNKKVGEEPVKKYDHGMDADRYLVAFVDEIWKKVHRFGAFASVTKSGDSGGEVSSGFEKFGGQSVIGSRWGQAAFSGDGSGY